MSEVFGEQVIVFIKNEDGKIPLVTNFNEARFEPQTQSRSYKAISKRVHQHQGYNTGWTISLQRNKKDNYIQSLLDFNDWCIQKGLEQPVFTIEEIITHTYSVADIDPKTEMGKLGNLIDLASQKYLETIGDFKSRYNQYINTASSISGNVSNLNILQGAGNFNKVANSALGKITNSANIAEQYFKQGEGVLNSLRGLTRIGLAPFKEHYIYHNCVISTASHGHKSKENTVESIEFKASYRTDRTDNNEYTDVYLEDAIWNSSISNIEKNIEDKQDVFMGVGVIPYQQNFADLLLRHLKDTENLYRKKSN